MRSTSLLCFCALALFACMNETPIGAEAPGVDATADMRPADSPVSQNPDAEAPRDGATMSAGESPYAIKNADGSYSCNPNFVNACAGINPEHGTTCNLPAGTVCDGTTGAVSTQCACVSENNRKSWQCLGTTETRSDCPAQMPVHGASCSDELRGIGCSYLKPLACTCPADVREIKPRYIGCQCDFATSTWKCSYSSGSKEPFSLTTCATAEPASPAGPSVDGAKTVKDMSDAEVDTWCRWSFDLQRERAGLPLPQPQFQSNGYGWGWGGATFCHSAPTYCVPLLPLNECKRLLKRKPCGAKVKQLTNCFLTAFDSCRPVDEGCGPIVSDPQCTETLVQAWDAGGISEPICRVPLI